ncbi:MAG TPA: hypothetical protein VLT82_23660 [Myxococcaceae bacterium]|nr:hypothetical protein [Myxococcaceae bacterium]
MKARAAHHAAEPASSAEASPAAEALQPRGRKRSGKKAESPGQSFAAALAEHLRAAGPGLPPLAHAARTGHARERRSADSPAPSAASTRPGRTTSPARVPAPAPAPDTAAARRDAAPATPTTAPLAPGTLNAPRAPAAELKATAEPVRLLPPELHADPGLQGAILPRAAHVVLQAGPAGEVALHLRLREGVAEVRLDGQAAPALARHERVLSTELASQGLQLRLDVSAPVQSAAGAESLAAGAQGDRNGQPPPDDPRESSEDAPPPRGEPARTPKLRPDGRIHVEA